MKNLFILLIFSAFLISSCSDSNSIQSDIPDIGNGNGNDNGNINGSGNGNNNIPESDGSWLVDKDLVFDGGPGKDGIPALDNPELIATTDADYLLDSDLVLGLKQGNEVIAFPHKILDWHEIINVDVDDLSIAITYCPLTGTGVGWNRIINNSKTSFGVSGLLYKNNLIPYDRATDSNWSQLKLECVNGKLIGTKPEITILPEMKWSLWKKLYSQSKVVSTNTGFSRTYSRYPYGSYKTDNQYFIFPSDPITNNIDAKERVHAIIISNIAKVYRFSNFGSGKIIIDTIKNNEYLIVGNQEFIVSFELDDNTRNLEFSYNFNNTEVILSDSEGNNWNIFGEAVSGPRKGSFIKPAETSMMAYYFSIEAFYKDLTISTD